MAANATAAISSFAIELFDHLWERQPPGTSGMVLAPISVTLCLALILNAAVIGSNTYWEVLVTMYGSYLDDLVGPGKATPRSELEVVLVLDKALQQLLRQIAMDAAADTVELTFGTSVWLKPPFAFSRPYSNRIQYFLAGDARPLTSKAAVNEWVLRKSSSTVSTIIDDTAFQDSTFLLAGTLYLQAAWQTQFLPENTHGDVFFLDDRQHTVMQAAMMQRPFQSGQIEYASLEGMFEAVRLPFMSSSAAQTPSPGDAVGLSDFTAANIAIGPPHPLPQELTGHFAAVIIRPVAGKGPPDVAGYLMPGALKWVRIVYGAEVYLPRFQLHSGFKLRGILQQMGLEAPFNDSSAELDGMLQAGAGDLPEVHINNLYHKVSVDIAEGGMQGVPVPAGLVAPDWFGTKVFRADKPFIFAVQHIDSGANLFTAVVVRPEPWVGS